MVNSISPHVIRIFLVCSFVLFMPQLPGATEEYAEQTGLSCSFCHLDASGGGELTVAGKSYAATHLGKNGNRGDDMLARGLRLLAGFIHFFTAIFWFGTILYVHLILKPAYASSGLPRGELRVGIISMVTMGISGLILTYYRITSVDMLLHTRFGILLSLKVALYLLMVMSAIFVITVIGPRLKAKRREPELVDNGGSLTPEELSAYDGKEGRSSYFAFAGKIYDATHSRLWQQGVHMGRHTAGTDLTKALKLAPHGPEKILPLVTVGEFVATARRQTPLHERVFFFMAHMNLTIVFIIILILSLWRWG